MNYFAHALPYLDDPYFAAGTAVPDWLTVADRPLRLRRRHVEPHLADADPRLAALAGGIRQHFLDDARFHKTRAFTELSLDLAVTVRDSLADEEGFRPSFLGHLLVEVLLDATLVAEDPRQLARYYAMLDTIDPILIQRLVSRLAPRPTERLAWFVAAFRRERFLWDYLEDARLGVRLNQIMRRVGLPPLPEGFCELLPPMRRAVALRLDALLDGIPTGT